jgi:hypothetical protein
VIGTPPKWRLRKTSFRRGAKPLQIGTFKATSGFEPLFVSFRRFAGVFSAVLA